jgi:hypothetical protein
MADKILELDMGLALDRGENDLLLVDAWMSLNECVPGPVSDLYCKGSDEDRTAIRRRADAYDRFQVAFRDHLKERSDELEAVAFNFGAGNFPTADGYLDWFPRTLASYVYLGFHEYGWPALSPQLDPGTKSSAGTYRDVMEGIRADPRYGPRHKVIMTEAGLARMYKHAVSPPGDVGWLYEGDTISQQAYWRSLAWYNDLMCQDDYVLGACLFEVGHSGFRWESFRHLGTDNKGRSLKIMSWIKDLREQTTGTGEKPKDPIGGGEEGDPRLDNRIASLLTVEDDEADAYRLQEVVWMDPQESLGRHNIYVDVVDCGGERLVGERVRVRFFGHEVIVITEEKPGERWAANFPMTAPLGSYSVEVVPDSGKSARVIGLGRGTPQEPDVEHPTSFGLTFLKA